MVKFIISSSVTQKSETAILLSIKVVKNLLENP